MANKETDPRLYSKKNPYLKGGSFIANKMSKYQNSPPSIVYYTRLKYVGKRPGFSDRFQYAFDSQVVPTILPGVVPPSETPTPPQTFRLLNESGQALLTELSNNLRTE